MGVLTIQRPNADADADAIAGGRGRTCGPLRSPPAGCAERGGDLHIQAQCRCYITLGHRFRQDLEAVRAEAERALAVSRAANEPFYIGSATAHQAWIAWREGDIPRALELAEAAMTCWKGAAWPFPWLGLWPLLGARFRLGNLAGAIAAARGLVDLPMEEGGEPLKGAVPQPPGLHVLLTDAVEAYAAGDAAAAGDRLEEAIGVAANSGRL